MKANESAIENLKREVKRCEEQLEWCNDYIEERETKILERRAEKADLEDTIAELTKSIGLLVMYS
jgi:peptidoglycan hydrolase CwlO-like protein